MRRVKPESRGLDHAPDLFGSPRGKSDALTSLNRVAEAKLVIPSVSRDRIYHITKTRGDTFHSVTHQIIPLDGANETVLSETLVHDEGTLTQSWSSGQVEGQITVID